MALSLTKSPADTLAALAGERARRHAILAGHEASTPSPTDLVAIAAHREETARLRLAATDADKAVEFQTAVVAAAKAEEEKAGERRLHHATEKAADEARKVVHGIFALEEKLATELGRLAAHIAEVDSVNARLRGRGFGHIVNAEVRVRGTPAQTTPARFEDRVRWVMPDGTSPNLYRQDASGEMAPTEGGAKKVIERVQVQAEKFSPAVMPESLITTVALPGLTAREVIWPRAGG